MKKQTFDLDVYPFLVRPMAEDEGDGGYVVEYPDVQYCIADGKTPEEAIRHGRVALEGCLVTLAEAGQPIPQPHSTTTSSGQWRQRVPRSLHARLVERAAREGVSLNTLVTALIAEGVGRREGRG
jgi:antitoxin HicB